MGVSGARRWHRFHARMESGSSISMVARQYGIAFNR
jgi:transposase-like protein